MKRVKEFSIKLTEGDRFPKVEIDGEEIRHVTKLNVNFDSENAINCPWDNGFLVEYFNEEDGSYHKQTIGQSFSVRR